jgi:hypothetical protein
VWSGLPRSQEHTIESMFKACSFGMGKVTKDVGSQVLRVAVPIPCSGYTPQGANYQSSRCPFNGAGKGVGHRWLAAHKQPVALTLLSPACSRPRAHPDATPIPPASPLPSCPPAPSHPHQSGPTSPTSGYAATSPRSTSTTTPPRSTSCRAARRARGAAWASSAATPTAACGSTATCGTWVQGAGAGPAGGGGETHDHPIRGDTPACPCLHSKACPTPSTHLLGSRSLAHAHYTPSPPPRQEPTNYFHETTPLPASATAPPA